MRNGDDRDEMVLPGVDARTDPAIRVFMHDDRIVLRLVGPLDREAIDTLLQLLDGARAAGAVAVVDLGPLDRRDLDASDAVEVLTAERSLISSSSR